MTSRKDFLKGIAGAAGTAALGGCKLPGYCGLGESVYGGIPIGVITFSYWHMPVGYLSCLKYVKDSGLSSVELMGYDLEVDAGAPIWKLPWDQTSDEQAERAAWRAKVEPEKLYADVRALYADHGVDVHILKPECNLTGDEKQTDAELDYWFKAAKALGAKAVTRELPNVAKLAAQEKEAFEGQTLMVGFGWWGCAEIKTAEGLTPVESSKGQTLSRPKSSKGQTLMVGLGWWGYAEIMV